MSNKEPDYARIAEAVTSPEIQSALGIGKVRQTSEGTTSALISEMKSVIQQIKTGDLSQAEAMLIAQAQTLDAVFYQLTSQAFSSTDMHWEEKMRLALKAQSQSRSTLQALIDIKAPRQVAFVQQANIGHAVQVNNQVTQKKIDNQQNELLEVQLGERMDTRAQSAAIGVDSAMAAMEPINRAINQRRKAKIVR